ncbi:MAG TPA: hypothetical protein VNB23_04080 [Ramlibacter sp.]|nr:hypothetical protein [Ramlibacter sp.]
MKIPAIVVAVAAAFGSTCVYSQDKKVMPLPKPPEPVKSTLPLNAQPSGNGGVYVPVTKGGNVGVSVDPLKHKTTPNEMGGSVSGTIRFP